MLTSQRPARYTLKFMTRLVLSSVIACLAANGLLWLIKEDYLVYKINDEKRIIWEIFFIEPTIGEIFFSVFGVLYAIVVGLLIVDAVRRLRDMSATIQDEANTIEDVWECIHCINDSGDNQAYKEEMVKELHEHVKSVIEKEWKEMEEAKKEVKGEKSKREMSKYLSQIYENMGKIRADGSTNFIAVQALVGKMADLTSLRSKRLELALQVFHHPLRILIIIMSVVIAVGFLFLKVTNPWVHYFVVSAVVASLVWLHMVICDLDNPYGGYWAIDNDPFLQVQTMIKKYMKEHSIVITS